MEGKENEKQQEDFIKWCKENNLKPNEYKNLKQYLEEVSTWDSTQTRSEA